MLVKSLLKKLLRVGARVVIEGSRFEALADGEQVQIVSVVDGPLVRWAGMATPSWSHT